MTVKELIKQLLSFNPNSRVVIAAYEEGLTNITAIEIVGIKKRINPSSYEGEYSFCNPYGKNKIETEEIAVFIG